MGENQPFGLEPKQSLVHCSEADVPAGMVQELGPDRDAITLFAEPKESQEDQLLEFSEVGWHGGPHLVDRARDIDEVRRENVARRHGGSVACLFASLPLRRYLLVLSRVRILTKPNAKRPGSACRTTSRPS
jgi:hypothetical protein